MIADHNLRHVIFRNIEKFVLYGDVISMHDVICILDHEVLTELANIFAEKTHDRCEFCKAQCSDPIVRFHGLTTKAPTLHMVYRTDSDNLGIVVCCDSCSSVFSVSASRDSIYVKLSNLREFQDLIEAHLVIDE